MLDPHPPARLLLQKMSLCRYRPTLLEALRRSGGHKRMDGSDRPLCSRPSVRSPGVWGVLLQSLVPPSPLLMPQWAP